MPNQNKRLVLTFVVAGLGALFADHFLKPNVKKGLGI